jgi:hypothetical protein
MGLSAMEAAALITGCVAWITLALALGLDLLGRKRGHAGLRWMVTGLLVVTSTGVFSQFAHARKWPPSHLTVIDMLTLTVGVVGIVWVIVGIVIQIRPQHSSSRSSDNSR